MAIVVEDDFTRTGPEVDLDQHTATITGGQWALFDNTAGGVTLVIQSADDFVEPSTNATSGREMYSSKPDPTEADVDVIVEIQQLDSNSDDDPLFIYCRATNTDNLISLGTYRNAATNNFQLHEKVTGTDSSLDTANATFTAGDRIKLEVRGTTAKGYHDSGSGFVEVLSATVTGTSAGECGLGVGNLWVSSDDIRRFNHFDNYSVEEFPAVAGGSPIHHYRRRWAA